MADPASVYNYYRKMIALREHSQAFVYGDYKDLDPESKAIYAYTRVLGKERFLVVLNFSSQPIRYVLPDGLKAGTLAVFNLPTTEQNVSTLNLKGWEARVYRLP